MAKKTIKAVIFDMDGVISDAETQKMINYEGIQS
jgi:phosphoglycolate phosphatase-like HAD superfamily hydrolase